jgi:putative transposase
MNLNSKYAENDLRREVCGFEVCRLCGSTNVVKQGIRKNKNREVQRFKCKDCNHKFTICENGFRKMEYKPEIVTLALDLYFKGLSYRDIVDHLKQFYKIKITHPTIINWVKRFTKLVKENIDELVPKVSGRWQADEMAVNVNGKYRWLWNLIDEETRFLLVSEMSKHREDTDAKKVFRLAKERAGKRPETIKTDGLWSYVEAYKKEFWTLKGPRAEHLRHVKFKDEPITNMIERLQGTVREKDKVMRALDSDKSAIAYADAFRFYYNFIKPHMSLKGRTPAEVAGLIEENGNRWLSLIKLTNNGNSRNLPSEGFNAENP